MHFSSTLCAFALASLAAATPVTPVNPTASDPADVYAAQATAKTESPTSRVKGKVFDRYVSIWFENTDYAMAAADPNFAYFAKKGITLNNLFAVTHPSEPNYMAVAGGDYFGLDGDAFTAVPQNISTVVDLLEDKKISWGVYQEDMPYTGYQGYEWLNQQNGKNDYVRKHNPEILYNSVANSADRLTKIKNTTMFYEDLKHNKLPQWMFITPNMTSDAHDSTVTVAGAWLKSFLGPLLNDKNFMDNTLVVITFDENETYTIQNRVFSFLIGDVVPKKLVGTTDSNFYNHYSEIASVEANWGLHTLGRFDAGANVFSFVAEKTRDKLQKWNTEYFFNTSYPGIFSGVKSKWAPQPVPNTDSECNGRSVLPSIKKYWQHQEGTYYKQNTVVIPDGAHPPVYTK